jgi:DNA-binding transcriptional LysR family regulator
MLDPDLLRTFTAIVDTGGFTAAADAIHKTQSAVSLQMRRLEDAVGRPLFEKSGRGVRLTADGERLLPHARRILAAEREALAAFAEPDAEGRVVIGAPDDYATHLIPRVLPRFRDAYPKIEVELVAGPSAELTRRVEAGELDLALVIEAADRRPRGGAILLQRELAVWITSARHQAHEEDPLPLALHAAPCPHRRAALEALDGIGRRYRFAYTSVSSTGIAAAVRGGLAVGVVSAANAGEDHRLLGPHDGFPVLPAFSIGLRRRPGRKGRDRLDRLQAHLVEAFKTPLPAVA